MSAAVKAKVVSPEITIVTQDQGFHLPEVNIGACVMIGEYVSGVSGSETVAGKRTAYIGTWENHTVPNSSCQQAGEARRWYGGMVVGLTHSRGVNRVMPVEDKGNPLEGVSNLAQRGKFIYAMP
ncbi:MAG: hypothetical protein ACYS6K_28010 [Planctomycetota bacterium]